MTRRVLPPFLGFLFLALAQSLPAYADFSASGYLKSLYSYTSSSINGQPYWLDLNRARLSLDGSIGIGPGLFGGNTGTNSSPESQGGSPAGGSTDDGIDSGSNPVRLRAHVDYDNEVRTGSFFQSEDYKAFGIPQPPTYFDMEQTISTGGAYNWRQLLYRGWAGVETDTSVLRFGRQRVAWGTGKFWNPTDVLNPYQPVTLERDERPGVDVLYGRSAIGVLGQTETAYAFGDNWAASNLLERIKTSVGPADVSVMGGKIAASTGSWMTGGDFSTDLWEGNLHGEMSYVDEETRTPFWRGLIGYEYTFSSSPSIPILKDVWTLIEYYHNGAGQLSASLYQPSILLDGHDVSLAQDYIGAAFAKDLNPLVKLEVYMIVNLDDGSQFFNPDVAWNVLKNTYLTAGLQRFGGSIVSEYGRLPNIAYAQAQYFF